MLKGETPTIFGDGEQVRDYVYVSDVMRANMLALKHLEKSNNCFRAEGCAINDVAYNVGTGKGTSANELFAYMKEVTAFKGEPKYGPKRADELRKICLDFNKAMNELGWEPKCDIRKGLRLTMDCLTKQVDGSDCSEID